MAEERVERVTVLGAGLMGGQIGAEYALGGHIVTLVTRSEGSAHKALRRAHDALHLLSQAGLVAEAQAEAAADNLLIATDVRTGARDATVVIESVPEDLELKVKLLSQAVAAAAPDAIVASNTSSLSIEAIGSAIGVPTRTIGTHYWNPPTLMPLVEVVPGPNTSPLITERVRSILRALGKEPVVVGDIPGFVWNRLQFALLREALWLVEQRVATAEIVDLILERGLARRWSVVGPFTSVALGGQATFASVASLLFPSLACNVDPEGLQHLSLPTGEALSEARNRRDRALARQLREDKAIRKE